MKNNNKLVIGCIVVLVLAFCGLLAVGGVLFKAYYLDRVQSARSATAALPTALPQKASPSPTIVVATPTPLATSTATSVPTPTFTPTSPPTVAPTPTLASNLPPAKVIFSDNFDDPKNGNWRTYHSSHGKTFYANGGYRIQVTSPQYIIWSEYEVGASDAVISVDAQIVQSTGEGEIGLLCRDDEKGNFYGFEVTEAGDYSIWKMVNNDIQDIVPWTNMPEPYSSLEPGKVYRLTAFCSGHTLGLAINDKWVDVLEDETFSAGGYVGMLAGAGDKPGFVVQFDNLLVTTPPPQGALPPLTASGSSEGTASPTPQSGKKPGGKLLFADDFSDSGSGWDVYRGDDAITDYYPDGTYHIKVMEKQTDVWANPGKDFPANVVVEVKALKVGGPEDNDFGLICRYQNKDNFYYFVISSDGYYGIGKEFKGKQILLSSKALEYSDLIPEGAVTVHLRAACVRDTLSLWVNGKLLAQVHDTSITKGGDVGLIAGTFDTPGTEISFDDFVVYAPKP